MKNYRPARDGALRRYATQFVVTAIFLIVAQRLFGAEGVSVGAGELHFAPGTEERGAAVQRDGTMVDLSMRVDYNWISGRRASF